MSGCGVLTCILLDTFTDVLLINKVHYLVLTKKARLSFFLWLFI